MVALGASASVPTFESCAPDGECVEQTGARGSECVVIRVTTLHASTASTTAKYYTKYLAGEAEEIPGRWAGRQADRFGLSGSVSTDDLERLLSGQDPVTGEQLGFPLTDRTTASGKMVRAVAGFDATVSAPKWLSVLWALTGDDGFAESHDIAVQAVLSHLERFGATTRVRSNGGRLHLDTEGLTVAAFRQSTSRADDPQLHTHLVISGKVQTEDGRWLALDARMLKRHQRTLGGLYQSVLRAELTHRYGLAWGEIVKGQAEIAGVPAELLEQFSKRTAQVEDAMAVKLADFYKREGRDPTTWERAAMTREAATDTRDHKSDHTLTQLRPAWIEEAATLGHTAQTLIDSVRDAARRHDIEHAETGSVKMREVAEVLTASASAWHREDIVRAFCDVQRPVAGFDGRQWADTIETAVDAFVATCVDLDPEHTAATRARGSDGRSEWIEPVAARFTVPWIIAEENQILDWAHHVQQAEPALSATVEPGQMDALQRAAAAAVAGHDELVIVVGPAGTGKTTMLAAAVHDLTTSARSVYGVAPTANAAHTLGAETGMACDTVAKLLYEWAQPERPAGQDWQLPPGTTLIVDEAGMIGTPSLRQLSELADDNRWRLALVGDPNQIQAVGRGGMFNELCTTGRTYELQQVHRFTEPWEAAASLQLRNGNPDALADYEQHDRIRPGTLDEHLDDIANRWLTHYRHGQTFAVLASTNDHVDTINRHIQTVREQRGHYPTNAEGVGIAGGGYVYVGDVIATRRNARDLRTDHGEPIRNRDLWTISDVHDNGDLTATSNARHGAVRLPADYVAEHVQLGYATTEMGAQSITADAAIELASNATTCRNLYVALTRGRTNNTVCVITDNHDPDEALDILEHVLATDRADTPAATHQRQLAQTEPIPIPTHDFLDNNWIIDELDRISTPDQQHIDYGIER